MNTPARPQKADARFLGWIIAVCSLLFLVSVLVMSAETTEVASNAMVVNMPTERIALVRMVAPKPSKMNYFAIV